MQSPLQQKLPMSMDSPLSSINESIFAAEMPAGLPPQLPISSLKKNPKRGLIVTYLKIKGLGVELMFNKNVIELKDDKEYIKEAVDAVAIFCTK